MKESRRLLALALALGLLVVSALPGFRSFWVTLDATDVFPGHILAVGEGRAFAAEEGEPRVKQMKLSVWPEYDEPRVLVIYDGTFADTSGFPKQVSFRVPKGADVTQVCGISEKGEHLCQLFEVKQEADYNVVSYTLPVPHFFLEYYYNPVGSEAVRNIAYTFSAQHPTDRIDVEVQQPLRATDFAVTPTPLSTGADNQGFKYSQLSFEKVVPGQKIELNISYTKQDSRPSVPKKQDVGGGFADSSNLNIWILLGGAAVLGLVAYFVISRRPARLVPQPAGYGGKAGSQGSYSRPSVYSKQTGRGRGAAKAQGGGFCTGCGAPLDADDRFCPKCGKRSKNFS